MTLPRRLLSTLMLGATLALVPAAHPAHADALRMLATYPVGPQWQAIGGVGPTVGPYGIVSSPDGRHLYVSAEDDNVVDVFTRNVETGTLDFAGFVKTTSVSAGDDNTFAPRSLAVSPDGRYLYVAGHNDGILGIFARDVATGLLTFVGHKADTPGEENDLGGAEAVVVSPDGAHLYVASRAVDSVVVFRRDVATGLLTFVERQKDATDGVDGLAGARGLALSPDGGHLYVAGGGENAVAVFRRDPATGGLTFVAVLRDGVEGVDGLEKAQSVAVTPDGTQVLVTGSAEDKLAVFRRDPMSGTLTPLEVFEDGLADVDGLNGAHGIAISPDGRRVYVTGSVDDALAVFDRNPETGTLRWVERQADHFGFVQDFREPRGVVVSPDGMHVYAAAHGDDAVVAFLRPSCGDGWIDGDEVCDDGNQVDGDCCSADCRVPGGAYTPCADDGNPCTVDLCDGWSRWCAHFPNVAPCDDGAFCTVDDTCRAGSCVGTPRRCPAGGACLPGICDESTATCVIQSAADGSACDDGDAGTGSDVCTASACLGTPLPDTDGDGIVDGRDVCPSIPDADQADANHDGVGDACACTSPAPGRCLPGGGPASSDCLLEYNPSRAPRRGGGGRGMLRCADGDPACDRDDVEGQCTVGVAICLANADPRLARCRPGDVRSFELLRPTPDHGGSTLDRTNALAVETSVAAMGLEIRRQGRVVAAASVPEVHARCGTLAALVVPAPDRRGTPIRRRFRMRAVAADGRIDTDVLTVECRR